MFCVGIDNIACSGIDYLRQTMQEVYRPARPEPYRAIAGTFFAVRVLPIISISHPSCPVTANALMEGTAITIAFREHVFFWRMCCNNGKP
jgi:hypothetical protein